jgi:hypothetical protein
LGARYPFSVPVLAALAVPVQAPLAALQLQLSWAQI